MLTTRINPRKSAHVHRTLGIILPDINESYGLEIRRGVVQFHQSLPENPDLTITLNKSFLNSIMVGESAGKLGPIPYTPLQGLFAGIDSGDVKMEGGNKADVETFFGYFDPPSQAQIMLIVR